MRNKSEHGTILAEVPEFFELDGEADTSTGHAALDWL